MASRLPCLRRTIGMLSVLLAASAASDVLAAQYYERSDLIMSATGHNVEVVVAVEPLTAASTASKALEREAKLVPFEPHAAHHSFSADFFAFINCDVSDSDQVNKAFIQAIEQEPMGVIFYSTEEDYCQYTGPEDYESVFTTANKDQAKMLREAVGNGVLSSRVYYAPRFLKVQRRQQQNASNVDGAQPNALGPTPSTSVALIILYSITGVITALFLLIIVSGAIRAHRHPERYGPRAIARFGQPRQSRAKGIARAVLDTLPIVRFSANREEAPKATDIEMNNREGFQNAEQRSSEEGRNLSTEATEQDGSSMAAVDSVSAVEEGEGSRTDTNKNEPTAQHLPQLKCPVCMDDFEQDQEVRVLPCQHSFHPDCIDPWLLNVSGSCPLCRNEIEHDHAESAGPEERHSQDLPVAEAPVQAPVHSSRFSRYLDLARGSTGQERLAALRQLREENIDVDAPTTRRRSLAPELGFARLRQVFHRNRHSMARAEDQADSTTGASTEHAPESV